MDMGRDRFPDEAEDLGGRDLPAGDIIVSTLKGSLDDPKRHFPSYGAQIKGLTIAELRVTFTRT
jgi:hypothetical protein